jgi:hypothetical protein
MITDPDKKATKRGWFRTLFSPFMGANIRRARLQTRDVQDARANLRAQRSANADVKELRRRGILK